jgi:hypothetical protein
MAPHTTQDFADDGRTDGIGGAPKGYWAGAEAKVLAADLKSREQRWYNFAERRGYIDMWLSMISEYYGIQPTALLGFDAAQIQLEGDQGELVRFRVNEVRSYIRLAVTSATKQRPAFQAATTASESVSERQVDMCESVMDAIYRKWYGNSRERRLVERGELFATMWSWLIYDPEGGESIERPVILEDGTVTPKMKTLQTPAIVAKILPPWQCITDPTQEQEEDHLWASVRERRSRWEMLNQYAKKTDPDTGEEFEDEEIAASIRNASVHNAIGYEALFGFDDGEVSEDDVVVTHFYHKACKALPEGRYLVVIDQLPVHDGPMPGGDWPLIRYQPAEFVGSALGYSDSWDLVVLNQMMTQLTSDMATNLSTFGRQSIIADKGTEFSEEQLANGMYLIRKPTGANDPHALMMAEIPQSGPYFLDYLDKKMQSVAGQNSVTRGDPSSNIKSGTMAALFASIAQDYQEGRHAALTEHREAVANKMLDIVRRKAPDFLVLEMTGPNKRTALKEFRAELLRVMRRVRVKPVSAALRSRAGQIEVANFLKDVPGAIQTPEQAIEIITEGQITPLYRAPRANINRIEWENEQFSAGVVTVKQIEGPIIPAAVDPQTGETMGEDRPGPPVEVTPETPVLPTDNPFLHVPEHVAELSTPEALNDPKVRNPILAHIAWHMRVYRDIPPELAALLKFPPVQALQVQATPTSEKSMKGSDLSTGKITEKAADTGVNLPKPATPPEPQLNAAE